MVRKRTAQKARLRPRRVVRGQKTGSPHVTHSFVQTFGFIDGVLMHRRNFAPMRLPVGPCILLVPKNVLAVLFVPVHVRMTGQIAHTLRRA